MLLTRSVVPALLYATFVMFAYHPHQCHRSLGNDSVQDNYVPNIKVEYHPNLMSSYQYGDPHVKYNHDRLIVNMGIPKTRKMVFILNGALMLWYMGFIVLITLPMQVHLWTSANAWLCKQLSGAMNFLYNVVGGLVMWQAKISIFFLWNTHRCFV